jgi:hypothetical protein
MAVVANLEALDPSRPIREADIVADMDACLLGPIVLKKGFGCLG